MVVHLSLCIYINVLLCSQLLYYNTQKWKSGTVGKAREHLSCECGHKVDVEGEGFTFK